MTLTETMTESMTLTLSMSMSMLSSWGSHTDADSHAQARMGSASDKIGGDNVRILLHLFVHSDTHTVQILNL
jgi:hypothetical protein